MQNGLEQILKNKDVDANKLLIMLKQINNNITNKNFISNTNNNQKLGSHKYSYINNRINNNNTNNNTLTNVNIQD